MAKKQPASDTDKTIDDFLRGKSPQTVALFHHFTQQYKALANVTFHPAKTMIGVATSRKRIAYITQLGKDFIHVVFPFEKPYDDNLCFQKIAQVPGEQQYNHHFRMYAKEDLNEEVKKFMRLAYEQGS
ncbi:hypothetical protein KK083_08830 [Fulvivirgaceae bacterium PWU4]|uniref:DUF5655 domain-containing protein n=1 Tax=Chryseosolibacter histidini TaxID=2782349 RepID=A0AAP2DIT2_9BACT|nr:DUF5655 domain-containing protein [Chryseosolibacter histidini]MBT1696975.1 hypothetical protein [Chryseosolibacter histidini]